VVLLGASWLSHLLNILIVLIGLFLILVVLIQRGKGGGLAGAFGGAGGSSAFGTRAGDTFTKITIGVAAVWALLLMIHARIVHYDVADAVNTPTFSTDQKD
jgi:preprotein translocase subunit SecG